jgi:tRNA dimethylallyltransferase
MKPPLLLILGATGSGKSELAVEIARELGGEILNADSRQVYRYLDIGTGKPGLEERSVIPHHLFDLVNPDEEFDVSRYCALAHATIGAVVARNHLPVMCGGTGLYVKALTEGLFRGPGKHEAIRRRLEGEEKATPGILFDRLSQTDPETARMLQHGDTLRIIRALEVYEVSGRRISAWRADHMFREKRYSTLKIGLNRPKAELHERIRLRCTKMFEHGLVKEVESLEARGFGFHLTSLRSIGYREVGLYLKGELPLDEAIEKIIRETKRYAKRQMTWFKRDSEIRWRHPEEDRAEILTCAKRFFQTWMEQKFLEDAGAVPCRAKDRDS